MYIVVDEQTVTTFRPWLNNGFTLLGCMFYLCLNIVYCTILEMLKVTFYKVLNTTSSKIML